MQLLLSTPLVLVSQALTLSAILAPKQCQRIRTFLCVYREADDTQSHSSVWAVRDGTEETRGAVDAALRQHETGWLAVVYLLQ